MTQRERQLLNWIEENPLISQQELADKAGITRSSVAVHISNLSKQKFRYLIYCLFYRTGVKCQALFFKIPAEIEKSREQTSVSQRQRE